MSGAENGDGLWCLDCFHLFFFLVARQKQFVFNIHFRIVQAYMLICLRIRKDSDKNFDGSLKIFLSILCFNSIQKTTKLKTTFYKKGKNQSHKVVQFCFLFGDAKSFSFLFSFFIFERQISRRLAQLSNFGLK